MRVSNLNGRNAVNVKRCLAVTEGLDQPLFSSTGRVALREVTVAVLVEDIEGAMDAAG